MDVCDPTGIPARIDRCERYLTVRVGELDSAAKRLADSICARLLVSGVDAVSITVPDINAGTFDRRATVVDVHDVENKRERNSCLSLGDILPEVVRVRTQVERIWGRASPKESARSSVPEYRMGVSRHRAFACLAPAVPDTGSVLPHLVCQGS